MKKNLEQKIADKIIRQSLDKIMDDRFGRYSKYVIQNRAIPEARDGLKPVQRRILYSMLGLGLTHDKPYKKSARVVGDVIGKYHPHGDSSVYEAMVNMSQWWKINHPLLDMHGNVGSIDNDPAAAMRYTEVRMSPVAEYVLGEIKKNPVKFAPNFDDSEIEPIVLPSLFPNLLVNGASGIAVGMATEMPPHNLNEIIDGAIYRITNPFSHFDEISKIVKGPDFPTGGVIKGNKGILEALEFGNNTKNKIRLFSKYTTSEDEKHKYIEITEIPYGVVKSKLVYEIDKIIKDKLIDGITEIKDQSDRDGISILITLNKNANERSILNYLLQKTNMQVIYTYNNTCILKNEPVTLGVIGLLDAYVAHVKDIKVKTLTYDLEKLKLRLELVEGFIKVSEISDEVIAVIRRSEGSKVGVIKNLIKEFGFTQNQATAIAEMRLYRLSKTDKQAYLNEKLQLEKDIKKISKLLIDPKAFDQYIIEQLMEIKVKFGTPRKTQIEDQEYDFSYEQTDLVKEEILNIGVSRAGYIKRFSQKVLDSNKIENYGLKDDDYLVFFGKVNSLHNLIFITAQGNYIVFPAYKIPEDKWKDNGTHLSDYVDIRVMDEIVGVFEVSDWNILSYIALATKDGYVKKTVLKDFEVSRVNKIYKAINIQKTDAVVNAVMTDGTTNAIIITEKGNVTKYSETELPQFGTKAKGNKGVYLSLDDKIATFTCVKSDQMVGILSTNGQIIKINSSKLPSVPKNIKGKPLLKDNKKFIPYVCEPINDESVIYIKDDFEHTIIESVKSYGVSNDSARVYNIDVPSIYKMSFNVKYFDKDYAIAQNLFSQEQVKKEKDLLEKTDAVVSNVSKSLDDILRRIDELTKSTKK
ncbi:DNA topoisomerase (ATP-hydrolyzing) [Mycoplasma sp. 888]|uniref:DNA topoisomerase (ATP-hydrolyzing) n=1 Tax=Mycoplasma sp. 888 TaxID=3108483 RepID=UPI002D795048|nr:DNA topoisomerase (ATP-hydrolyzing) [Mycoplasma sp. 888]WRQ25738.1 DNA topoisomerase (ATP-hydrolyzing) [Mycoplasma sp. 888]